MDVQLAELIDKIKAEGVGKAEQEAQAILDKAQNEASDIVEKAKSEAEKIVADGKREVAGNKAASEDALKQASRDLILSVQTRLTKLFDTIVAEATEAAYSPDVVSQAVLSIVQEWAKSGTTDVAVLVPESRRDSVEQALRAKLAEQVRSGVAVEGVPGLRSGFRVGEKDGNAYFDFSAEGVADALAEYLNPRLTELMKQATAEKEG